MTMTFEEMKEYQKELNETEVFYDGVRIELDGMKYDADCLDWRKDPSVIARVLELREIVFMIREIDPNAFVECKTIAVEYSGMRYEYDTETGIWTEL